MRAKPQKVLLIGSGPIQIGQAAEFDYSGSQACKSLREENVEVVLVNSNPATIMTDPDMADSVYVEPLTPESVAEIIRREEPDGIVAGLGGQTGLNLTSELAEQGFLEKHGVDVLGTPIQSIQQTEDRDQFKKTMEEIDEEVAKSKAVNSLEEAQKFAREIGFPVIVRPAYTLGGSGGGSASNPQELERIGRRGLNQSRIRQVLIEESLEGWKEFEYEVMRDGNNCCIVVTNMENFDPMGIHTGDSIVVTPSQTLSDKDHQRLRTAALKIIRKLGIEGGCNIQFAFNSQTGEYKVVEVNPRVSRSSALASKATGYPIARVAAKIAAGKNLDEIQNDITKETPASFEPTIDYTVVKIPRWPFEKFYEVKDELSTQMKGTGEVMAIGRTLEEAFQKAVRSLDLPQVESLDPKDFELVEDLEPHSRRLFAIYHLLKKGKFKQVREQTNVDSFMLEKIRRIGDLEKELKENGLQEKTLARAKRNGFTDEKIGEILDMERKVIDRSREKFGLKANYKMVDTCAGEFSAETPFFYSTFEQGCEANPSAKEKALILGAGPIRIGQGIEFDYCCVHALQSLREEGIQTLIINNNPETVSTDYDQSDKLFFEPLSLEDVLKVIQKEKPDKVLVQFGGQTSINNAVELKDELKRKGLETEIAGTDPEIIDKLEDRGKFYSELEQVGVKHPPHGSASSLEEAKKIADRIGYPVLVRPSYVLGGRAMKIIKNESELKRYIQEAAKISKNKEVLIDKFLINATELDIDAVSDGEEVLIGAAMEHIEQAGIHSGDSACVIPPQKTDQEVVEKAKACVRKIAKEFGIQGFLNVQLAVKDDVYVLEANPRASRTVPYVSKYTGVPLAKLAAKVSIGKKLKDLDWKSSQADHIAVKEVVLPFDKFEKVNPNLGPEMKSTGEVMGIDYSFGEAFYKAQKAAGNELPLQGKVFVRSEKEFPELAEKLKQMDFEVYSTQQLEGVNKISVERTKEMIREGKIDLVVDLGTDGEIKRECIESNRSYLSTLGSFKASLEAIKEAREKKEAVKTLTEYQELEKG